MIKIILVPHTHWDREWYFSDQVADVLLQRMKKDILSQKTKFHFNLDGQASLLDELFLQELQNDFLEKNKVTTGPLYIQQDTFNTLFSTTINNIEIGKKILAEHTPKTVYMPDSFGFNEQLPQIFRHYGFENFVAWRGIKPEDKVKSNLFWWKGFDASVIKSSVMAEGYFALGESFPYNQENDYHFFQEKLIDYIKTLQSRSTQNVYWVPIGADQAPYEKDIPNLILFLNSQQNEYFFCDGRHDDYFDEVTAKNLPEISTKMNYSGTSKIHRTIHSNRYDMKKWFRDTEILIYYQMEPLEIIYQKMNGRLLEKEVKDKKIYKELLKSSAHDSLGGCNSDNTNALVLARTYKVYSFVKAYVDLMLRDIRELLSLNKREYLVFNLAPFKRKVVFRDVISSKTTASLSSEDGSIFEYRNVNLSWVHHGGVYNHHISIVVDNMEPFSYRKITLCKNVETDKTLIPSKIDFCLKVEEDQGDEYDFSDGDEKNIHYYTDFDFRWVKGSRHNKITKYVLPKLNVKIFIFENQDSKDYQIVCDNKLKNRRVSLDFGKFKELLLSRHLAFVKQQKDDIPNWKEQGYKDKPVNFFTNDGLINNGKFNILTKGTNEVCIEKNLELTLYRTVGFLGQPYLKTRPGVASGLLMKYVTLDSQLPRKLRFDLRINKENSVQALNDWYFQPLGVYKNIANPILNKMDKFAWNKSNLMQNCNFCLPHLNIDPKKKLVGRLKLIDKNKTEIISSNPFSGEISFSQNLND